MDGIIRVNVQNPLPERLAFLNELTQNLWWCWSTPAQELLRRISPTLWDGFQNNPLVLMSYIKQKGWQDFADDSIFIEKLVSLEESFRKQVKPSNCHTATLVQPQSVAYFSLEYGLHESLCIYSGGLGVLAGDYLKTASDRNYPLVAVGLYYHKGYFKQHIDQEGRQTEIEQLNNPGILPLKPALTANGSELEISVPLSGQILRAKAWRVNVGNIPLFLLDANIPENSPELRGITNYLYGGDKLMRLRQELLLGIGGFQLLTALGYEPQVCHMNEGHSSFLSLARISHLQKKFAISLEKAVLLHRETTVFTTHTPVAAGNETFDIGLLRPYVDTLLADSELSTEQFLQWGVPPGHRPDGQFSMTILGCYTARFINGVSKLHGKVARSMWSSLWPNHSQSEVPIVGITNGVHLPSWISPSLNNLYTKFLGEGWLQNPRLEVLEQIDQIPDFDFWQAHIKHKALLIRHVRKKLEQQMMRYRLAVDPEHTLQDILHFDRLTIGFARRFATYKRANLLLQDPDRLERLIRNQNRPVQFIFAGKAHPADHPGKELIQRLVQFSRERNLSDSLVFVEDYGIKDGRMLVQGVDVWLNNPIRPEEASGTSGMKAAINGIPNCSVLDGWWVEGYSSKSGWAIGSSYVNDQNARDKIEAESLFNLLENKIAPLYYGCDDDALPREWIKLMKATAKHTIHRFSSSRMFSDYDRQFYQAGLREYQSLTLNKCQKLVDLDSKMDHIAANFHKITVSLPQVKHELSYSSCYLNDELDIKVEVNLGDLRPTDVRVELYSGILSSKNHIVSGKPLTMTLSRSLDDNRYVYSYTYRCSDSGRRGLAVRVIPALVELRDQIPGYITWAGGVVP